MTHEKIHLQYMSLISELKQEVNLTYGLLSDRTKEINEQINLLQEQCDHQAPPEEFIDSHYCPFCHKDVKEN